MRGHDEIASQWFKRPASVIGGDNQSHLRHNCRKIAIYAQNPKASANRERKLVLSPGFANWLPELLVAREGFH
jgi:hypothetical protein